MWNRMVNAAQWISSLGVILMLGGLGLDAQLHALDPDLAAHEGIFTFSNPGHGLLAAGIAVSVAGTVLFLLGRARQIPRTNPQLVFASAAFLVVALALTTFAMALTGDPH